MSCVVPAKIAACVAPHQSWADAPYRRNRRGRIVRAIPLRPRTNQRFACTGEALAGSSLRAMRDRSRRCRARMIYGVRAELMRSACGFQRAGTKGYGPSQLPADAL
jgi:hypothetical protein